MLLDMLVQRLPSGRRGDVEVEALEPADGLLFSAASDSVELL
eukprot:CAMPEP_0177550562 /NCGR_PEP_ID=MMETSP0369-20130122/65643_1 /TAXON_ID=447022 ORGANISM="Scrippsiella hangoei-like, Strain SHHI-4" /NCGR_SAMPLE_ID=MMETSP0369 /ASSEMBLY_ACC=CAM_ASM_000364 /LENGTH=41 /DNA_ID= /DNA_START= /DNA_END= /DNA_ORIENTATION=